MRASLDENSARFPFSADQTMARQTTRSGSRYRTVIAALLIVYWIALFVATHLPHVPSALETRISDKSLHGGSYALLALLLAAWHGMRRKVTWSTALGMLAIIAAYGAFDELTQIPVGRHADILDWRADIVGGIIGIGAYILAQRLIRSVGQRRERAGELDV